MNPNAPPASAGDLFVFYGLLKLGAEGQPADLPLASAGVFGAPCRFDRHGVTPVGDALRGLDQRRHRASIACLQQLQGRSKRRFSLRQRVQRRFTNHRCHTTPPPTHLVGS